MLLLTGLAICVIEGADRRYGYIQVSGYCHRFGFGRSRDFERDALQVIAFDGGLLYVRGKQKTRSSFAVLPICWVRWLVEKCWRLSGEVISHHERG